MKLGTKQELFAELQPAIVERALQIPGVRVRHGELWRPPEMARIYAERGTGILGSLHTLRLAIDELLFRGGRYLDGSQADDFLVYQEVGEWWKSLHPLCCWGGDFTGRVKRDLGHFSITHNGVK